MKSYELNITNEVDDFLHDFAMRNGVSISETVRRAFALLRIADEEKRRDPSCTVGIVREHEDQSVEVLAEIKI